MLREYKAAKGGVGHVFSINIIDNSDEPRNVVKATFFNEMALKYHEQLEEGKCYIFSGGEMKPKTLRFNTTLHNCEVVFNKNTSIKPYDADDSKIPKEEYRFELVNKVEKYEKYHQMDVMVVIQHLSEPEVINMKNGGVATLRNM